MSFDYQHTRELVGGSWNINNMLRVDGSGFQIRLPTEIGAALPGKKFMMQCHGSSALFKFETELSSEEQTTLSTTIQNHKDNT